MRAHAVDKTFGQAFGDLIRAKRAQEGLTQKQLAIEAFDDESKARRIIDLENGAVQRPQAKTIDALVVYFGITKEELAECRQHGLFSSKEQATIGLSRELIENLAFRFEHENPDAPEDELIAYLKEKAAELKTLKRRLLDLEETGTALNNQIAAANNALEHGGFEEADEILASAEEIQQEEKTLKEISTQSRIRFARGDAALFSGKSTLAATHYAKAAEYFNSFNKSEMANILSTAAGQIYEYERRSRSPNFVTAIELAQRAFDITSAKDHSARWVLAKYHLALLQQAEARRRGVHSLTLLNDAISNSSEALRYAGKDVSNSDKARCLMVLGNSYLERSQRDENKNWASDVDAAISAFEEIVQNSDYRTVDLDHSYIYNNISSAHRNKARRSNSRLAEAHGRKAKDALLRAIELSVKEKQMEVWSIAQYNLGGMLAEEAEKSDPETAKFLRIQSIAAFLASLEMYLETALNMQLAQTQSALGRVLLEHATTCHDELKEVYLFRSIAASEIASKIFGENENPMHWSDAQFHIGLAFIVHAEISEPEVEAQDLEKAVSYFDSAIPGYEAAGPKEDLKKLKEFRERTVKQLKKIRPSSEP
jgi:transcriptional regulator with XRE-family HTH domain